MSKNVIKVLKPGLLQFPSSLSMGEAFREDDSSSTRRESCCLWTIETDSFSLEETLRDVSTCLLPAGLDQG
jgi:hypothetical protein